MVYFNMQFRKCHLSADEVCLESCFTEGFQALRMLDFVN